jgi:outer membrane lipoprotein
MVAVLSACATTPPFPEETLHTANRELTPEQAVKENARDVQVLWGGVIIKAANTADHTDLTVLFYPLDNSQRPDLDQKPRSRFIVRYPGYLEIVVYAPGREVTILGSLQGVEEGKVGDALYSFPVVQTDKVHLWPVGDDSKVHFGVGLGIGVHM